MRIVMPVARVPVSIEVLRDATSEADPTVDASALSPGECLAVIHRVRDELRAALLDAVEAKYRTERLRG